MAERIIQRKDETARLLHFETDPGTYVSLSFSDSYQYPGILSADGAFGARIPLESDWVMVILATRPEGAHHYVEDAVYMHYLPSLMPGVWVDVVGKTRCSDTFDPPVIRTRLRIQLDRRAGTLDLSRDRAMNAYNRAVDAELKGMGIAVLPAGEQTLVVRTHHGVVPLPYTFIKVGEFAPTFAHRLMELMCSIDDSGVTPADLYLAGEDVVGRVLSRCTLLACSVRYVPDEAMTKRGLEQCNLFSNPMLDWSDDCEGCTLVTWWAWAELLRAFRDDKSAIGSRVYSVLTRYTFHVVVCTFVSVDAFAQHMCAALVPKHPTVGTRAVLLESTTRTLSVFNNGEYRPPPPGCERPLVFTGRTINNWYHSAHLMFRPDDPDRVYVPCIRDRPGILMQDLLLRPHELELRPLQTLREEALCKVLRRKFEADPTPDLRAVLVELGERGPDYGSRHVNTQGEARGEVRPSDSTIRVNENHLYVLFSQPPVGSEQPDSSDSDE